MYPFGRKPGDNFYAGRFDKSNLRDYFSKTFAPRTILRNAFLLQR